MSEPGQSPPSFAMPPPRSGTADAPYAHPLPRVDRRSPEPPGSSVTERLVYAGWCSVAALIAAFPAAWLWIQLADPPSARLDEQGLKFGETSFDQVTTITLWFFLVGLGFGLVTGSAAAVFGPRHGWWTVVVVVLMSWVGSSVMLWCGVHVFGPDNPIDFVALFNGTAQERTEMLKGHQTGDTLVSAVTLSTPIGLLGWPVGGMLGALAGASLWPTYGKPPRRNTPVSPYVHSR